MTKRNIQNITIYGMFFLVIRNIIIHNLLNIAPSFSYSSHTYRLFICKVIAQLTAVFENLINASFFTAEAMSIDLASYISQNRRGKIIFFLIHFFALTAIKNIKIK